MYIQLRKHIAIFASALSVLPLTAQTLDINTPEKGLWPDSPMAAKIRAATMPQSALSTGAVQFDLPLYTLDVDGMAIDFALRYCTNGIRPDEDPYPIGYGWSMLPAMKVTRQVLGRPDEAFNFIGDTVLWGKNHSLAHRCMLGEMAGRDIHHSLMADAERDIITFCLPQATFNAVLDSGRLVSPGHEEYCLEAAEDFDSFTVTDPQGRVWVFDTRGATNEQGYQIEWGLSSVTLQSGKKMTVAWERGGHLVHATHPWADAEYFYVPNDHYFDQPPAPPFVAHRSADRGGGSALNIKKVSFPGGTVEFGYAPTNLRGDVLTSLTVKNTTETVRRVTLSHGSGSGDEEMLLGVTMPEGSYSFEYDPQRYSGASGTDLWGYFNNRGCAAVNTPSMQLTITGAEPKTLTIYGADRSVDTVAMQSRILRKATFPTGGTVEWEYEPHRFKPVDFVEAYAKQMISNTGIETLSFGGGLRVRSAVMRTAPEAADSVRIYYLYGKGESGLAVVNPEALPTASTFLTDNLSLRYEDGAMGGIAGRYKYGHIIASPVSRCGDYRFGEAAIWYDEVAEVYPSGRRVHRFHKVATNRVEPHTFDSVARPISLGTLFSPSLVEYWNGTYRDGERGLELAESEFTAYSNGLHSSSLECIHIKRFIEQTVQASTSPDFSYDGRYIWDGDNRYDYSEETVYGVNKYYIDTFSHRPVETTLTTYTDDGLSIVRRRETEYVAGTGLTSLTRLYNGADTLTTRFFYNSVGTETSIKARKSANYWAADSATQTFRGCMANTASRHTAVGRTFRPYLVTSGRGGASHTVANYGWNDDGTLSARIGADGVRTSWTWDAHGRHPLTQTLGDSLKTTLTWKPLVGVASSTDPAGVKTTYGYDPAGRLNGVWLQRCRIAGYAYRVAHDGDNRVTAHTLTSATDSVASVTRYDRLGRPWAQIVQTPGGFHATMTEYDACGRDWRAWAAAPVTSCSFTPHAFRTSAREFHGDTHPYAETEYERSPRGRSLGVTREGDQWHRLGKQATTRRVANNSTTYGCPLYTITSDGIGWDGSLHKAGTLEVTVTTDEDGLTTETYTDLRGLTLRVKRGALATDYVYDGYGDLRYVLPPALTEKIKKGDSYTRSKPDMLGYAYWYDYDHRGLVTLRKLPGRDAVRYIYDPAGRLAVEQDGNSAPSLWTIHLYDRYGREVVTGNARWSEAMVNEYASKVRAFAYTGSSRAGGYSNAGYSPGMNEIFVSRRYNSKGQMFKEEGGGMTATYEYNTFGHVKKKVGVYPQVTVTEETSYTYSGKPSKTVASFSGCTVPIPTTTTLYTYDKADRLVKTETSLAGSTDSSAVVVTAYDAVGRASSMRMGAAVTRTMDYDVHGWLDSTVTVVRRQSLTASGVLAASLTAAASFPFRAPGMSADIGVEVEQPMVTTLVERLLYAGGKNPCYNGNISSRIFPGGRYDYTYDAQDRLTAAEFTPAAKGSKADYSTAYAYDPNGNLKSLSRKGVTDVSTLGEVFGLHDNITYTLTGNQVTGLQQEGAEGTAYGDRTGLGLDGIYTLDYDANGNLLSDSHRGIHSIAYNHLGQPSSIVLEDKSEAGKEGERIVNFYDPSGTKYKSSYLSKNGHGISTRLYAGPAVVEGGSLKMVRFPGGYFDADGMPHYYLTDYQGNVTHVVTRTGAIVQQASYYPYGEPWREPTGTNRYLFGGKEREHFAGLNLSDFGPRLYDSGKNAWSSPDLLSEEYAHISNYVFGNSNPANYSDPSGLEPVYTSSGRFLGCTREGFTGDILIYDGEEDIDWGSAWRRDHEEKLGMRLNTFDAVRKSDMFSHDALTNIWNHVISQFDYKPIGFEVFTTSRIAKGRVCYSSDITGGWATNLLLPAWDGHFGMIFGSNTYEYESTVENLASSIIVHEWYSHAIKLYRDSEKTHHKSYETVILNNPFWAKTTDEYKRFNFEKYIEYANNEGVTVSPLILCLYSLFNKMYLETK